MRTLAEFTKTTLIGGVSIILPIYISILLIAKAISGIMNMVKPITASIPASVEFREVLAILVLAADLLHCWIACTHRAQAFVQRTRLRRPFSPSCPAIRCCAV